MMFCLGFLTCLGLIVVWTHWRDLTEEPRTFIHEEDQDIEKLPSIWRRDGGP